MLISMIMINKYDNDNNSVSLKMGFTIMAPLTIAKSYFIRI